MELNAYRFSEEEIKKMIWLKKLFEKNDFIISRFPETYYDTFDNACTVLSLRDKIYDEKTPDYLGIYIYNGGISKIDGSIDICELAEEGLIVLFSDRIKNFAKTEGFTEDSVRFVVLMHELGHWFTHWPKDGTGKNWKFGFQLPNKKTKEGLAQLIAYWSSNGNMIYENVLDRITPRNPDGTPNMKNPYDVYLYLIRKRKSEILTKLTHLRNAFYLNDVKMLDYLISKKISLKAFVGSTNIKEYVEIELLKSMLKCSCLFACFAHGFKISDLFDTSKLTEEFGIDIVKVTKGSLVLKKQGNCEDYE